MHCRRSSPVPELAPGVLPRDDPLVVPILLPPDEPLEPVPIEAAVSPVTVVPTLLECRPAHCRGVA